MRSTSLVIDTPTSEFEDSPPPYWTHDHILLESNEWKAYTEFFLLFDKLVTDDLEYGTEISCSLKLDTIFLTLTEDILKYIGISYFNPGDKVSIAMNESWISEVEGKKEIKFLPQIKARSYTLDVSEKKGLSRILFGPDKFGSPVICINYSNDFSRRLIKSSDSDKLMKEDGYYLYFIVKIIQQNFQKYVKLFNNKFPPAIIELLNLLETE